MTNYPTMTVINKQGAGGVTYTLSPTSIVEFRLGITHDINGKWPIQIGLPNMQDAYGIPGLPTDTDLAGGLNTQTISGYAGMGRRSSTPQFQNPWVINPKINFSKIFARHTLKLGYEFLTLHTEVLDFSPPYYYTPAQMTASKASGITTLDGLAGKSICAGEATTYLDWLSGKKLDLGPKSIADFS